MSDARMVRAPCLSCNEDVDGLLNSNGRFICPNCRPSEMPIATAQLWTVVLFLVVCSIFGFSILACGLCGVLTTFAFYLIAIWIYLFRKWRKNNA
jgi:hypothetical protein